MGTRYRVTVERIDDVEGAQYETRETVLFEATLPRALRLASFAPDEIRAALMEEAGLDEWDVVPQRVMPGVDAAPPGVTATVFNAAGEVIDAVKAAEDRPKRKRRTKAEVEADKAREEAGQLAVDAAATAQVGEAADTVVEQVQADRWPDEAKAVLETEAPGEFFNPFTRV